ncbi:MAG: cell wall hydrolase [Halanaerobiales bacterium]|nr:cell wall hydrolase [Halanaerobiales bacterium]
MKGYRVQIIFTVLILSILFINVSHVVAKNEPVFRLVYTIQEGDNLTFIAKKYNIKVSVIKKANDLTDKTVLYPGKEIRIPFGDQSFFEEVNLPEATLFSSTGLEFKLMDWGEYSVRIAKEKIKVNIPTSARIVYHIQRGDNLYDLAQEFSTTVSVIKALNNLDNSAIRIGQEIILPTKGLTAKQILSRTISDYELNLLARVIHGESRGEPYLGKVAVGAVILNRVISSRFSNTIEKVILQKSQFEAVSNGQINLKPSSSAYKAAREALNGSDPTLGALYFINPKYAPNAWWFNRKQKTVTIGGHVFAK